MSMGEVRLRHTTSGKNDTIANGFVVDVIKSDHHFLVLSFDLFFKPDVILINLIAVALDGIRTISQIGAFSADPNVCRLTAWAPSLLSGWSIFM